MISVIVPIFNEEKTVTELYRRIFDVMKSQKEQYEIIFVNDCSRDKTKEIASKFRPLKLVSLQRNYGQTAAIDMGIYTSRGDIIVLLDADLQNDPAEILTLLKKMDEGFEGVNGKIDGINRRIDNEADQRVGLGLRVEKVEAKVFPELSK